jgi:pimeloyl-[acyl-carrier protein] methyl ester esterase
VKTVVLLHGWGVRPAVFEGLRAELAHGYEVRTPALAGYDGTSSCAPYDLDCLAQRVASAAPDRCFVAGWSLGGQVALAWAKRSPRQVERVALIATTPCFVQRDAWKSAMEPHVLQAFASALEVDANRTLSRFALLQARGDTRSKSVVSALRRTLASPADTDLNALRGGLEILLQSDLRPRLQDVAQEAIVLHGKHDTLVPLAAAEYLASSLPRAKLTVLRDSAHAPFVANPGSVGRELQAFFA